MTFQETCYAVVPNIISKDAVMLMQRQVEIMINAMYYLQKVKEEDFYWGDHYTPKAVNAYGHPITEGLLEMLRPRVESITGVLLHPSYSFLRRYFNGSTLHRHRDRPSCQYSVTFTLESEREGWPIWLSDRDGNPKEVVLRPGDGLIYRGDMLTHWREKLTGKRHTQVFLHYVEVDGQNDQWKLDKRPILGVGPNTK